MRVVFTETFEGVRGRLGRSAIVDVDGDRIGSLAEREGVIWELQKCRYSVVREITEGAMPAKTARIMALDDQEAKGLPVFFGGIFETVQIR